MADANLETMSDSEEHSISERAVSPETRTEDLFSENGDDPPLASDERQLGLDINRLWGWSGSSYSDYDVVTVHGIRDDYKTAWTKEDGTWWVVNKLFEDLSMREVDYSYEIDEEATIFQADGIKLHAERLLTAYAKERANLEEIEIDRPIIWICHDIGGTIVKEALCRAINNSKRYGKIAILTTAIIFLGTPHRFQSTQDLEDQIHNLLLLPGPDIRHAFLSKVRNLAFHVNKTNDDFLATKLLDRAAIINVFAQNWRESLKQRRAEGVESIPEDYEPDDIPDPVTPFSRYTHFIGQSFEASGRRRVDWINHADLIRGDSWSDGWIKRISNKFNRAGCMIKVNYQLLQFQAHLLSQAPPTKSLDTKYDPLMPIPPILSWIYKQEPYLALSKAGIGPRLMHIYTNGSSLVDIKEISRLFYVDYDSDHGHKSAEKSIIYFEFDQWDSRYNNISSMLFYFINTIMWRFWNKFYQEHMIQELNLLNDTRIWSLEDLYHVYSTMRFRASHQLTFFLCGFDQCPEDQRRWFLGRVLEEQDYSEAEYRLILSTSKRDGLAVENVPDAVRINVDDCPATVNLGDEVAKELETGLSGLLKRRLIYGESRQQLELLLRKCENTPYLGHVILTWLENYPRGRPKSEIATRINELWPPTAETIVHVIISSISPELRERAKIVFNWVKYALEPWSAESLAEALAVFYAPDQEPCFIDLHTEDVIKEIAASLCGIIIVKGNDVKFSHSSFYLVPAFGVDGNDEERAAIVNSTMAEICLRYLQYENVQDAITESCSEIMEGNGLKTPLDAFVISHSRASMAGYAVRFWPRHYEAGGPLKPRQLVFELFASKKARGCWETYLWLLSNPLTRPERGYISTLPTFARLGLEDLIDETVNSEINQSPFNKDCWFAITEAARMGRSDTVRKLLQHVSVDEEELQTALLAGAGQCDADTMSLLLEKIPELETFQWPKHLFHRASAVGLGSLLTLMLQSGYDINELGSFYKSSPAATAAWRNSASSLEVLLDLKYKADLSIKSTSGDTLFTLAVYRGNPRIVEMVLKAGADLADTNGPDGTDQTLTQIAVYNYRHKAADILVRARADFNSNEKDDIHRTGVKPPLIIAARLDARECARILLTHGADPLVSFADETALYAAVANNNIEIARLLLEQEQKPDLDAHPPEERMLLMRAIEGGNADLVSMLVEHGAKVEFVDPKAYATPLSSACRGGNLDIVKFLVGKDVDINYTGGVSESPLFAATYADNDEVVAYLLQDERIDVHWAKNDGVNALMAAYTSPETVRKLLERGVSVDHYSSWGTILHLAAPHWPKTIKVVLEHDPKPDLERVCGEDMELESDIGCTPLQIACQEQTPECVELLLNAGANAKFRNTKGVDAVDILLQSNKYSKDTEQCLRLILSEPGQFDPDYVNAKGQTRLHEIKGRTPVAIIQLLVKAKVPLDRPDNDGYTPLAIAIRKSNTNVAKYLIDRGASVNIFSPRFGSILHLAVAKGDIGLVRLLIDSGADCEAVDPKYGASLLYTALGINNSSELLKMVKYLVDEAKVPINKLGGEFSYPVIKAADITRTDHTTGIKMLKFLIRRKAQLNVTDRQGRRAVHLACTSRHADGIKSLAEADAEVDVKDRFGRMPIHFAASSSSDSCVEYLLDTHKHTNINAADHDGWTPLLWAARSGDANTITRLIAENADVWVRGRAYGAGGEWSALKLVNFADRNTALREELEPKERVRTNNEGEKEEWNDYWHECMAADKKNVACKSCLVDIIGLEWKCIECSDNFSLCFKCYSHRSDLHDSEHTFQEIEPVYAPGSASPSRRSTASPDGEQGNSGDGEGNSALDVGVDTNEELDASESVFDLDDFDLDADD